MISFGKGPTANEGVRVWPHTHTHTQAHTHIHTHARACMQAHMLAHTHTHTDTHTHPRIHTQTHTLTHPHIHTHVHPHPHCPFSAMLLLRQISHQQTSKMPHLGCGILHGRPFGAVGGPDGKALPLLDTNRFKSPRHLADRVVELAVRLPNALVAGDEGCAVRKAVSCGLKICPNGLVE